MSSSQARALHTVATMGKTGWLLAGAVLVVGCAPLDGLAGDEKSNLVEQDGEGDKKTGGGGSNGDPDSKDGPLPSSNPGTGGQSTPLPAGMLASFDFEVPAQQTAPDFLFSAVAPLGDKISASVRTSTGTKRVALSIPLKDAKSELYVSLRFRVDMAAPVQGDPSFFRALDESGREVMRLQLGSAPGLKLFKAGSGSFVQTNPGLTPSTSYRVLLHLKTGIGGTLSASLGEGTNAPTSFVDKEPFGLDAIKSFEIGNVGTSPQSIAMTFDDVEVSEKPLP